MHINLNGFLAQEKCSQKIPYLLRKLRTPTLKYKAREKPPFAWVTAKNEYFTLLDSDVAKNGAALEIPPELTQRNLYLHTLVQEMYFQRHETLFTENYFAGITSLKIKVVLYRLCNIIIFIPTMLK